MIYNTIKSTNPNILSETYTSTGPSTTVTSHVGSLMFLKQFRHQEQMNVKHKLWPCKYCKIKNREHCKKVNKSWSTYYNSSVVWSLYHSLKGNTGGRIYYSFVAWSLQLHLTAIWRHISYCHIFTDTFGNRLVNWETNFPKGICPASRPVCTLTSDHSVVTPERWPPPSPIVMCVRSPSACLCGLQLTSHCLQTEHLTLLPHL